MSSFGLRRSNRKPAASNSGYDDDDDAVEICEEDMAAPAPGLGPGPGPGPSNGTGGLILGVGVGGTRRTRNKAAKKAAQGFLGNFDPGSSEREQRKKKMVFTGNGENNKLI